MIPSEPRAVVRIDHERADGSQLSVVRSTAHDVITVGNCSAELILDRSEAESLAQMLAAVLNQTVSTLCR